MRMNVKKNVMTEQTHEGAPAYGNLTPYQQLRRSMLSCFLWENGFYEDGKTIVDRIVENSLKVRPEQLADLAIEARTKFNLRHAPLLLLVALAKIGSGTISFLRRCHRLSAALTNWRNLSRSTGKTARSLYLPK